MTDNRMDTLRVMADPNGYQVYDTARNKLNVLACDILIRPGQPPLLQISLPAGRIDVVGTPLFALVDPDTGRPRVVKRVDWADGAFTEFPVSVLPENVVGKTVVTGANGGSENVVADTPDGARGVDP
jgi:hypothetical protein